MSLILRRTDEAKEIKSNEFIGEDGVYKITFRSVEQKVWEFEGNRKGNKYYNMQIQFENGRTKYIGVHYQTKDKENGGEGDIIQTGLNFAIEARRALEEDWLDKGKDVKKLDVVEADMVFAMLIKDQIPLYLAFRQSEWNDKTYFNLNDYFIPAINLGEAEEKAAKANLSVIHLKSPQDITKHDKDGERQKDYDGDLEDEDDFYEDDL